MKEIGIARTEEVIGMTGIMTHVNNGDIMTMIILMAEIENAGGGRCTLYYECTEIFRKE